MASRVREHVRCDRHRRRPQRAGRRRPTSRQAGLRTLVLERAQRVGGTVETRPLADGRRAPGLFHTVGRLRPSGGPRARPARPRPGRSSRPRSGPSRRSRTAAPSRCGRTRARTAAELRAWSAADAAAWVEFDRHVRALAAFVASLNDATPPATSGGGPGRRAHGPAPGPRLQEALAGRRPPAAARPADGDRRLRGRVVRERARARGRRDARRRVHRARRLVDGHDRRAARGLGRQRRRRRGPDRLRAGRPGRARRRARRRRPRLRRRDPDGRRGGRRDHARRPRDRRRRSRPARRSRRRSWRPASTRSGRCSGCCHRWSSDRTCAGGSATSASRVASPGSTWACPALPDFPAAGDRDEGAAPPPGPDPRRRHRARRHRARLRRRQVRPRLGRPPARGDDPDAGGSVARARRRARDERDRPVRPVPARPRGPGTPRRARRSGTGSLPGSRRSRRASLAW